MIFFASFLASLLFFSPTTTFAQGVVVLRQGYVQVNGRGVETGDAFRSQSEIETESESLVRLAFADSSFVHVGPKSRLTAAANSESATITLHSGWVWVRSGLDRRVRVTSGDAWVEAQGADFIFYAAGAPRLLVLEGSVRFSDGDHVRTVDGSDLKASDLPRLSELSNGEGAAIAIERKFLFDIMVRLKGVDDSGLVIQGEIHDGHRRGVWESWSPTEGLQLHEEFVAGVLHGRYSRYYGDGRLQEEGRFDQGQRVGHWVRYSPHGLVEDEGEYRLDQRVGEWRFYSLGGSLVRRWNFTTQGPSAVPRWQWGLAYLGAWQKQGSYNSGAALVTRCWACDERLSGRFDVTATWLKFQEESTGPAIGAHLGLDIVLGPVIARFWYGGEYLIRSPLRSSMGLEFTRVVGRDFHSRDWQPFVRVSSIEMGSRSDITVMQVGLWQRF